MKRRASDANPFFPRDYIRKRATYYIPCLPCDNIWKVGSRRELQHKSLIPLGDLRKIIVGKDKRVARSPTYPPPPPAAIFVIYGIKGNQRTIFLLPP